MYVAVNSEGEWHQFQGLNVVIHSQYRQHFRASGGLKTRARSRRQLEYLINPVTSQEAVNYIVPGRTVVRYMCRKGRGDGGGEMGSPVPPFTAMVHNL